KEESHLSRPCGHPRSCCALPQTFPGAIFDGIKKNPSAGAPEEIRTPDPQIRSLVLYPAELRARLAHRAGSVPERTKSGGSAPLAMGFAPHWQFPGAHERNLRQHKPP